jgi:hypothetical protein
MLDDNGVLSSLFTHGHVEDIIQTKPFIDNYQYIEIITHPG